MVADYSPPKDDAPKTKRFKQKLGGLLMLRLLFALIFLLFSTIAGAQQAGSVEAYSLMAGSARRAVEAEIAQRNARAAWHSAKKITYLKKVPEDHSGQFVDLARIEEGWEGEISFWEFKVLDIENQQEMLLFNNKDEVIWLVGYPTKAFTTDQVVRIVGPVKAGPTKSYDTVDGSERTVRTFQLQRGPSIEKFEKELEVKEAERQRQAVEADVKKVVVSIIWGTKEPVHPRGMDKRSQRRYKDEIELVGRLIKASKITAGLSSPMTFEPKKKRIEFDSEESRTIAQDHLKFLTAEIPK